jgi:hypothetical protein
MRRYAEQVHLNTTKARASSPPHVAGWALPLSLLIGVIALAIVLWGVLNT